MKTLFALLLCSLLTGCLLDSKPAASNVEGRYDFTATNTDGSIESKGWIDLKVADDGTVTGTWDLSNMTGDKMLEGAKEGDRIMLNFHPGWADHNFFAHGEAKGTSISGRWDWIGFAGVMRSGTFIARK